MRPGDLQVRAGEGVAAWVSRKSFRRQDLPRTAWGVVWSSDGALLVVAAVVAVGLASAGLGSWAPAPLVMLMAWVLWTSSGRAVGLGLYDGDVLVGGFRLKVSCRRNRLSLVGSYVDPEYRQRGGATLLLAAALDLASTELRDGGQIVAFTPTHPASRRLVEEYVAGGRMIVGSPEFSRAQETLRALQ